MKTALTFLLLSIIILSLNAQNNPITPGVLINHFSKSTNKYIGSPSICILPDGDYVASHDEFGPGSTEYYSARTHIFVSRDQGITWTEIAQIDGQFWSNLFVHKGELYIMGTNKHHGNLLIRKSVDNGKTWTNPYNGTNGLILEGEYHTAPMPMIVYNGKIWRSIEYATGKTSAWGKRYSAMMISIDANADLLNANNWIKTNHLPYNPNYLGGKFEAWLEGNAVATKDGNIVNILRVHSPDLPDEYCAVVNLDTVENELSFDEINFRKMPGASKKFSIRYDESSGLYLSIVNNVPEEYKELTSNDRIRNTVSLVSSPDLKNWTIEKNLLFNKDYKTHAFQYIDWAFDGDDIIFVSRTAFDDNEGGAISAHDSNYLTFHRIKQFRQYIH